MATKSTFVQPSIPRFNGHYDHWAMLMKNFFRSKEYWSLVESGRPAAAEGFVLTDAQKKNIEDLKLKDLKAKNYMSQALDRSILETILNKDKERAYGILSRDVVFEGDSIWEWDKKFEEAIL